MRPELLSPAGDKNSLIAAINAGCDAVYLAGKRFGARGFAGNFSDEEIIDAINTSHLYGVKVYVTLNTLIYDDEVEEFLNYVDFIHKNNVDAVIMQDIGMIDLVRKTYPNLEIHASTQANIHNLEGAKLCEKLGLKRVVLARETSINLIKEIKKNTNIELEIFVHGALCMSYSGECLMSALIGNRSGNRGTCAQCCRQPYDLIIDNKKVNSDSYLLSTKDLNTLNYIGELIDSGVHSLKIEGRMKSPEYVYLVTSLYRKAIDNYIKCGKTNITDNDIKNLKKVFNREFTKGFIFGENNSKFTNPYRPNHIGISVGEVIEYKNNEAKIKLCDELSINDGIRIISNTDTGTIVTAIYKNGKRVDKAYPNDIVSIRVKDIVYKNDKVVKTTDYNLMNELKNKIKVNKKIGISTSCILKLGKPIKIIVSDYKNMIELSSKYIVESSLHNPTNKEIIKRQLNKLGDTIYKYDNLEIIADDNIFVPVVILNELRREVINILNEKRLYKINYIKEKYEISVNNYEKESNTSILIHTLENYLINKDSYDIIYVDNEEVFNSINDSKCVLKIDRINEHLKDYNNKLLVSDLGSIYKYSNIDADFPLNVVNSYSVAVLHYLGAFKITLSYELTYEQIKNLINIYEKRYNAHPNLEVIVKSREEVMVCKYNLLKDYIKNSAYLKDKFNNNYQIKIKNNLMYIYNYKERNLKENYFEIGVNNIRIDL